jgi:hypothetical protein
VRFQVRAKAFQQLFEPDAPSRHEYSLGWKSSKKLPAYFARDFDPLLIGDCELQGYRTDLFLFAWHGPHPITHNVTHRDDQSDPNNYDYFIWPARAPPSANDRPLRNLAIRHLFAGDRGPITFAALPAALNAAADEFLRSRKTGDIADAGDRAPSKPVDASVRNAPPANRPRRHQ